MARTTPRPVNLSDKEHTIYFLYASLLQSPTNWMRLDGIPTGAAKVAHTLRNLRRK
jgi:hypothetical protein